MFVHPFFSRKRHPELEPLPQLEPLGGWTSRAAQVTRLVRLRVCSPAGHAPSTGRLAFLLRPVAQRADCTRLVPCCASRCRPATSDGGHKPRCGRCCWCHGWSPRSGCFRDRGWAGCARYDDPGCFQHRNSISAHWTVRETAVSFFLICFERGRGTPQHARLVRSALVGGEEKKWRSRVKVKSGTRALALLVV